MIVKELKEALAAVPDHLEVVYRSNDNPDLQFCDAIEIETVFRYNDYGFYYNDSLGGQKTDILIINAIK